MAVKEAPQDMIDKVLEAVEIARTTGKICKGTNETTKAIEKGKAKLVVVAKDVSPAEIVMHIPAIAAEKNVPCVQIPKKDDLGSAAGIDVSTGSVAIINEGDAKNLIKEIVEKLQ